MTCRTRKGRRRCAWALMCVGLAGLACGLAVGQGLLLAGSLMVTTAALIELS